MVNITNEDWEKQRYTSTKSNIPNPNIIVETFPAYNTLSKKEDVALPIDTIRPNHYGGKDNTYEVFNVLEAWNLHKDFYLGNVIKYIKRCELKDPTKVKEDLQKALVYLQRKIDTL